MVVMSHLRETYIFQKWKKITVANLANSLYEVLETSVRFITCVTLRWLDFLYLSQLSKGKPSLLYAWKSVDIKQFNFTQTSVHMWLNDTKICVCLCTFTHGIMFQIKYFSQELHCHYCDIIMGAMSSQITSLTSVYSTIYSSADQRNIKAPRRWPLCGECTGCRRIPRTNGQ